MPSNPNPVSKTLGGGDGPSDERTRALLRLVPLWPAQIADMSIGGRRRLVAMLERALKAERRRGRAGHWSYDLARHVALLAAWKRELAEVAALTTALTGTRQK
jgi:hypothetical protein